MRPRILRRVSRAVTLLALMAVASVAGDTPDSGVRLRVMAANISSGRHQSYPNPGPGVRIFQALQPDVVLIQEFNVNAGRGGPNDEAAVESWVDDVFGADYHWFREPGGDSIPNGVISRWPIVESGEWTDSKAPNRDFAFARIDLPGEIDLWAVSLHLLTRNARVRNTEAQALVSAMRLHSVPEADYLVIGGDFNTDRRNEPAVTTLGELVDILGPFPEDGGDPSDGDTNSRRRKPYDWVLTDGDLEALSVATEVGNFVFPDGLVFDSRVFTDEELADGFPPVRRGDSGAPQMQHMAVVRDFEIGGGLRPVDDFTVSSAEVDFGSVVADAGPVDDSSVEIRVAVPFSLTAAVFAGSHPQEFALRDPDLSAGPVAINGDAALSFVWAPEADDGELRRVTATLVTDGEPGAFEIELTGGVHERAASSIDLGGYRLEQTGRAAVLVLPAGTVLDAGGILVVGRAVDRSRFEDFWGPLPPGVAYLNGATIAGEPGFPVINGGEDYRLLDAEGRGVDPRDGELLDGLRTRGRTLERRSTLGAEFVSASDPGRDATPGRYRGETRDTGRLVVTEISDAPGPGSFVFEFVEVFYDAAPITEGEQPWVHPGSRARATRLPAPLDTV